MKKDLPFLLQTQENMRLFYETLGEIDCFIRDPCPDRFKRHLRKALEGAHLVGRQIEQQLAFLPPGGKERLTLVLWVRFLCFFFHYQFAE